jgi:hypothetical protein
MECRLAGETEVLRENLPQRHFCPSQNPTCLGPVSNLSYTFMSLLFYREPSASPLKKQKVNVFSKLVSVHYEETYTEHVNTPLKQNLEM